MIRKNYVYEVYIALCDFIVHVINSNNIKNISPYNIMMEISGSQTFFLLYP